MVYNTGFNAAFVTLGNSSAAATTSNDMSPTPNGWMAFAVGPNTFLAAIAGSGTTTPHFIRGLRPAEQGAPTAVATLFKARKLVHCD